MTRLAAHVVSSDRNRLTGISGRLRTGPSSPTCIEFGFRQRADEALAARGIWFRTLMRFGFCLMIVAFVLMGVEVAYALYQLAGMIL